VEYIAEAKDAMMWRGLGQLRMFWQQTLANRAVEVIEADALTSSNIVDLTSWTGLRSIDFWTAHGQQISLQGIVDIEAVNQEKAPLEYRVLCGFKPHR
jgi:hypothetical protein